MRTRDRTLWSGARAADELLRAAGCRVIQKAEDPNKRRTFDRIVARVATDLAESTHDLDAGFAEKLLSALDLDVEDLTAADLGKVYEKVHRLLPDPQSYVRRVVPVFAAEIESIVNRSRATALPGKVGPLSNEDLAVLEAMQDAQAYYIRSALMVRNEAMAQRIKQILDRAIEQGWRRTDLSRALHGLLDPDEVAARGENYFDVVASAFAGNARSFGVLSRFRDAGIKQYQWESVLDEVTSDICRFLHGTVFEVEAGLSTVSAMASNVDGVKDAAPWLRVGRNADGEKVLYTKSFGHRREIAVIERSGVGVRDDQGQYRSTYDGAKLASVGICLPPAHGRCRSTILAVV